jgi:RNase adapter protein RapZ
MMPDPTPVPDQTPAAPKTAAPTPAAQIVLVTGPSGAGRTTAVNALEDLGFEVIQNLPLSLLSRLLDGPPIDRPLALGLDTRNRDFSTAALIEAIDRLAIVGGAEVLYLDCRPEVLVRRYSETRRRHPLAPDETPETGIAREADLLAPVRARADVLIDTSDMTPHDLRAEIAHWFAVSGAGRLAVSLQSFSYKRGLPRGLDMVFDVRFLRNPYWDADLRPLTGQDPRVAAHVAEDTRFAPFIDRLTGLLTFLLPAYVDEGKAHLAVGFGCTGGQHRSVAVAERLALTLAQAGWQVSTRHRELDWRAPGGAAVDRNG